MCPALLGSLYHTTVLLPSSYNTALTFCLIHYSTISLFYCYRILRYLPLTNSSPFAHSIATNNHLIKTNNYIKNKKHHRNSPTQNKTSIFKMTYLVTEPSPSTTSYIRCGRGGAGNTFRAPSSTSTTNAIPSSSKKSPSMPSTRFFSGIGGAGNAHSASERPPVTASLDDAVRHAAARDNASVGYCGRGGAGNVYRRKESDASTTSSASSVRSGKSSTAKLWSRVSGTFGRE